MQGALELGPVVGLDDLDAERQFLEDVVAGFVLAFRGRAIRPRRYALQTGRRDREANFSAPLRRRARDARAM